MAKQIAKREVGLGLNISEFARNAKTAEELLDNITEGRTVSLNARLNLGNVQEILQKIVDQKTVSIRTAVDVKELMGTMEKAIGDFEEQGSKSLAKMNRSFLEDFKTGLSSVNFRLDDGTLVHGYEAAIGQAEKLVDITATQAKITDTLTSKTKKQTETLKKQTRATKQLADAQKKVNVKKESQKTMQDFQKLWSRASKKYSAEDFGKKYGHLMEAISGENPTMSITEAYKELDRQERAHQKKLNAENKKREAIGAELQNFISFAQPMQAEINASANATKEYTAIISELSAGALNGAAAIERMQAAMRGLREEQASGLQATPVIQANTQAVEENIKAKKKQSKIKVRDFTREEYDAAQEKFQQENNGALESLEDTVDIIRQASKFGTSFSTQMETSCKRATTAVQRFFSAIDPDKYPALAGWKDSILESVQNGYFSEKEMYNGMYTGQYSWGVEAIDEDRYYVFLNFLDVAKDKEKEYSAYLNEEFRKRDAGLEKESELLAKIHARYAQLNQLHSYNPKWDNNDQITSIKNRLSYYTQERVLLQDIVDLKEDLNSIDGKYKSRNTADALRAYTQNLYLGDYGNATLADNERATAIYRAELEVAIQKLDKKAVMNSQAQVEVIEQQTSATETLTKANNDLANSYLKVQEAAKKSLDVTDGSTFATILKYYKELLNAPQDNKTISAQKALIEKAFNGAKTPSALSALQYADDSELAAMGNKLMLGASFEGEFLFKQVSAYLQDVVKSTIDWNKALESVEQRIENVSTSIEAAPEPVSSAQEQLKVEQQITAEKQKQIEQQAAANKEVADTSKRVNQAQEKISIGYHAGDLGKAEWYGNHAYGSRDTGHFGTGTYFVGNPKQIEGYNKRNGVPAPVEQVDFSKYNLFKPETTQQAYDLHRALSLINSDLISLHKYDGLDLPLLKEQLENGDKSGVQGFISKYLDESTRNRYEAQALQYKERLENVTKESIRADVESNYMKSFRDLDFSDDELLLDDDMINEEVERQLMEWRNALANFNLDSRIVQEIIYDIEHEEFDGIQEIQSLKDNISDRLSNIFTNLTKEQIADALEKTYETISQYKQSDFYKLDSASTVFMKNLGYEGIDVRHTELDNTAYGSVIYDLKGKDLERRQEILKLAEAKVPVTPVVEPKAAQNAIEKSTSGAPIEVPVTPVVEEVAVTSKGSNALTDLQQFDAEKETVFTAFGSEFQDNQQYLERFKSIYQTIRENLANGLISYEEAYTNLAQETNNLWTQMQNDISSTSQNIKKLSLAQRAKMFDGAGVQPLFDAYRIEKRSQNEIYDEFDNLGNMIATGVDTDSIEAQKSNIVSLVLKSAKREVETGLESFFEEIRSGRIYYDNDEIREVGKDTFAGLKNTLSSYNLLTPNRKNGLRADEYFTSLSDYAQNMIRGAFEREYHVGFNGSKSNIMQGIATIIQRAPSKFANLSDDEQEDVRQRAAGIVDKVASNVESLLQVESKVTDELENQNEERKRGTNAARDLKDVEDEKSVFPAEKVETEIDRIRKAIHSSEIGLDQIANTEGLQAAVATYVKSLDEIDDKKFKLISADINEMAEGVDRVTLKFQSLEDENVKLAQTWAMDDGNLTLGRLRTTKTFVDSESSFDAELERTVANSRIDVLQSQLIGIDHVSQKVTDSLASLRTAAGNISSDSDIKTFAKNFQVAQNYVKEFKNEYKTLGSLANETQNAQAKMANAQEIINAQLSSSAKYIGVDGYDKVTGSIDGMTVALLKYNEAQQKINDGGLDAEAVSKYEKQMTDAFTEYNKAEKQLGAAMKEVRANASFDNFAKSMRDAEAIIDSAKAKLDKFGELDGVGKANGYITDMANAWQKFNNTESTIKEKAQAVKDFEAAQKSLEEQMQRLGTEGPIKKYATTLTSIFQQINDINSKIYALKLKDDGSGALTPLVDSLEDQKNELFKKVKNIAQQINATFNDSFILGDQIKFPSSILMDNLNDDADTSGTIKNFFNDVRTQATLTEQAIDKFVATLQDGQNKTNEFVVAVANKFRAVLKAVQTLKDLNQSGEISSEHESYKNAQARYNAFEQFRFTLSVDPAQWSADQHRVFTQMADGCIEYISAVSEAASKEAEYFKSKKQYVNVANMQDYDAAVASMDNMSESTKNAKESLENFVKSFTGGKGIITDFTTSANGISKINFGVIEEGTNQFRTFSAEMGTFTDKVYTYETSMKSMTAGTDAAKKALASMSQVMSRLNANGFTVDNNDYVKSLYEKMQSLRGALAKTGTSKDAGGQSNLQNMANDANRAIKALAALENAWLKVNSAVADGDSEVVGSIGKNEDVYKKMVQLAQDVSTAMPGSTLSIDGFNQKTKELTYTIEGADGQVKTFVMSMDKLSGSAVASVTKIDKAKTGLQEFLGGIGDTGKQLLQYGLRMVEVYDIIRYLRQGFNEVLEIDTAMTELKKVTDETAVAYDSFAKSAYASSKKIGSTMKEFIQATADFARLGYSIDEASQLAEAANVYKNVGDGIDDVAQASESIISTMKAFNIEATDSMGIVDRFNEIGNNFAIDSVGIGEALQRSASALAEAGNSIDESIALVTAANSVVQNPEQVGTALKTLALRLRGTKTELEEAGLETDNMAESTSQLQAKLLALTHGKVNIMKSATEFKNTTEINLLSPYKETYTLCA